MVFSNNTTHYLNLADDERRLVVCCFFPAPWRDRGVESVQTNRRQKLLEDIF